MMIKLQAKKGISMIHAKYPKQPFSPIPRPRINDLLAPAFNHALTTVIAGTGTGKSIAVSDFVTQAEAVVVWHDASTLDNFNAHFWEGMLLAYQRALPSFMDAIMDITDIPPLAEIDHFIKAWRKATRDIPLVFLVIDNFQCLENEDVNRFLLHTLEADLENLRIILISSRQDDQTLHGLVRINQIFSITAENIAFTCGEVRDLLNAWSIPHTENHIERIMNATDGWAFAVSEYARQIVEQADTPTIDAVFDPLRCHQLLRGECYINYARTTQLLLVKLSLLPAFSTEIVKMLSEDTLASTLYDFHTNPFILHDPQRRLFRLQVNYRQFLQMQAVYILDAEIEALYRMAGDWFERHQFMLEAIDCFGKSHQNERAFLTLQRYALPQLEKPAALAVQQFVEELPATFFDEHPLAHVLMANLKIGELKMDEAFTLLKGLQNKYENLPLDDQTAQILGETYLSLAELGVYQTRDDVLEYAEKAYDLLPYGSVFRCEDRLLTANESVIVLTHCDEDTLPMMLTQHQGLHKYEDRLYGRYAKGFSTLYEAEVAIALGDMRLAEAKSYEALRIGRTYRRHDIVCNALFLMAQTSPMLGDLSMLMELATECQEYVQQRSLLSQRNVCDYMNAWIYLLLQDYEYIPRAIKDPYAFAEMPQKTLTSREMLIHCRYWMNVGDYRRTLVMIDTGKQYAKERNLLVSYINFFVLEAICYERTEANELAVQALYEAYKLAKPGKILMPFTEMGRFMRTLINTVRRQSTHPFDEEWLSLIYAKASTYAKRVNVMIQQYEKKQKDTAPIKLSSKEQVVLELLVAGLTRDEISERMGITVHGVKRHITSLYNKLGAANRSDAIRLATTMRLIDTIEYDG